jgi:hypothetical protein
MKRMTSTDLHKAIREGLKEVSRRVACGELDQSGRYYTDEELAAGAATGELKKIAKPKTAPAA